MEIDFVRLWHWLGRFNITPCGFSLEKQEAGEYKPCFDKRYHASGHASREDITWAIDQVDPAPSFCEVNFSTSNTLPRAHALWQIYKKRYLSRYFQEKGMRCFVDLNVASRWQDENLLGIPPSWRAFSTKVHRSTTLEELTDQAGYAESIRGSDDLLFVVFSNRSEVRELCQRQGWVYVDEGKSVFGLRESNKTRSLQSERIKNIQKTLMEVC